MIRYMYSKVRVWFLCLIYILMYYINCRKEISFNYLGNMITYGGEFDIDIKLNIFLKITGILNNVFRT